MLPGLCLAQLSGLPMTSFAAGGTGLTPFYVLGFELGPWQDYLAMELTPDYLADPNAQPVHVSWMDPEVVAILPAFADGLIERPRTWTRFEIDWQYQYLIGDGDEQAFNSPGYGFERQMLTSGLFRDLGGNSLLGVEAVLAYQSFGTTLLGTQTVQSALPGMLTGSSEFRPYQESGYGTGVRLNVQTEVLPGMAMNAGFQSRIDMEEFAYHRGVYSNPADFDIPARASLGLAFQTNAQSWLNLSIERVMYSEVNAFAGRNLPDQFLVMLGDSTSPNFAWDDLTVYTIGWTWSNGKDTQWRLDLSSRSSPSPTSRTLDRAISGELADHAMLLGYSKRMSDNSRFNVNAAYAPANLAFGGNVLGVATTSLDQDLELEAFWTWDF